MAPLSSSLTTSTIGYPRIGPNREMKKALETYWAGKCPCPLPRTLLRAPLLDGHGAAMYPSPGVPPAPALYPPSSSVEASFGLS